MKRTYQSYLQEWDTKSHEVIESMMKCDKVEPENVMNEIKKNNFKRIKFVFNLNKLYLFEHYKIKVEWFTMN